MTKGFSGLPGNMQGLLKQAQKMQKDLEKVQEESKNLTAEASSGGGVVKVVANGRNQISSIQIDKSVVAADDVEMLQDLIIAAVNESLNNVQEKLKSEMSKIAGGMNIPGLF